MTVRTCFKLYTYIVLVELMTPIDFGPNLLRSRSLFGFFLVFFRFRSITWVWLHLHASNFICRSYKFRWRPLLIWGQVRQGQGHFLGVLDGLFAFFSLSAQYLEYGWTYIPQTLYLKGTGWGEDPYWFRAQSNNGQGHTWWAFVCFFLHFHSITLVWM